jgi:hypothetical protein
MPSPQEVVTLLRTQGLRCRTGILAIPPKSLGAEPEIAAALDVELLDYPTHLLSRVSVGQQYLNLTLSRVFEDLDAIANSKSGESCVLVGSFDVAVSKLRTEERSILWRNLLIDFPYRTRALLLSIPAYNDESFAFPDANIRLMWLESERFSVWQPISRGSDQL